MTADGATVSSRLRWDSWEVFDTVAVGYLVMVSPVLILPELVWPEGRQG